MTRGLHCTVDVIMGYPVLSFIRRDGDEGATADYAADLHRTETVLASEEHDGCREWIGGRIQTSNITALRCGEVMAVSLYL